jgi:hypothetical protein
MPGCMSRMSVLPTSSCCRPVQVLSHSLLSVAGLAGCGIDTGQMEGTTFAISFWVFSPEGLNATCVQLCLQCEASDPCLGAEAGWKSRIMMHCTEALLRVTLVPPLLQGDTHGCDRRPPVPQRPAAVHQLRARRPQLLLVSGIACACSAAWGHSMRGACWLQAAVMSTGQGSADHLLPATHLDAAASQR